MKTLLYSTLMVLAVVALWYGFGRRQPDPARLPANMEEFKQRGGGAFTVQAGEYLIDRAKQGHLPGFSEGEHGVMIAPNFDPAQVESKTNPESRIVCFRKEGDSSEYYYIVVRIPQDGTLRLEKAWRANPSGQIVEEYRVQ